MMKTHTLVNALVLCGTLFDSAVGHPFNLLKKRVIKTEVVYVTETVARAVVYVDETGVPYLTSTFGLATSTKATVSGLTFSPSTSIAPVPVVPVAPTKAPSTELFATSVPTVSMAGVPQLAPTSSGAVSAPAMTYAGAPPRPKALERESSSRQPAPAPSAKPFEPSSIVHTEASDESLPLGITYDPFKGVPGQCQCKTADEMAAEFEKMREFGIMRIYGNDCGVIPVAVRQARKNGQKLMAGIYTPNQNIDNVVNALSNAIRQYNDGNWDVVRLVSVENERVNAHVITVANAHDSLSQARGTLRNAGYTGPVGVVETAPAVIDNPSLCQQSDMTLVNIHAFFDQNTKAEDAGEFVKREVARVRNACPDKRVVVTESGWPSQGTSHDKAVASRDAQRAAISSIRASFNNDLFLFNAFDSPWKTDDSSTFNSERWWGIL